MDFWDDIVARGEAAILDLCTAKAPEGQHLEFKRKSRPDQPGLTGDDKRALGESLSGMSNAEGGTIIFGLSDNVVDGADCADQPQLINDIAGFAGVIKSLVPNYLSPPHIGIEVLSIPFNGQGGAGVVAIRVGRSDNRPHMSLAQGHNKYFLRVGAANIPMLDFQIRDMMRVDITPRLTVGYQLKSSSTTSSNDGFTYDSHLILNLRNEGRASARQSYVLIQPETKLHFSGPASAHFQRLELADAQYCGVQCTSGLALHPGIELPAVAFVAGLRYAGEWAHYRLDAANKNYVAYDKCPIVHIHVSVGAENSPARDIEFSLDQAKLEEMAEHLYHVKRAFYSEQRF
jgi:hypothetical protein